MSQKTNQPNASQDYVQLMPALFAELGGASNVVSHTHCVSRLRLVLSDYEKVSLTNLEKLPGVRGAFRTTGQLHIVFGLTVADVYQAFVDYYNQQKPAQPVVTSTKIGSATQHLSKTKRLMVHVSEIFMPLIPILVAGGLILALRNILETKWDGTNNALSLPFFNGLYDFLWIPAAAVFWFLPVFICYTIFKKMNGNKPLGILIGLSLVVLLPSIYELNDVLNMSGGQVGWHLITDFFTQNAGIDFQFGQGFGWGSYPIKVGYTSQVIPAIAIAFLGVYLERFFNKHITPVLKQILVPLLTVLICYSLAMVVIGPVGFVLGTTVSIIISLALTNNIAKYITAPIFGFFYAPLVVTGLHHTLNAIMVQNTATLGGSLFFPILAISNLSQGASCLMYGLLNRKNPQVTQTCYPATLAAWFGVTEPAMYGVNTRHGFPFLASCIASALGALLVISTGVTSAGIGNGGWLGVLSIQATSPVAGVNTLVGTGYTWFLISAIAAVLVALGFTYLFDKTNLKDKIPAWLNKGKKLWKTLKNPKPAAQMA